MNYFKVYMQQYLIKYCEIWLESFDESSIKVGLLEGDVSLSKLDLKPHTFYIKNNLQITLEYGRIEQFRLQVPWSGIRSGEVNLIAEDINIVCRIHQPIQNNQTDAENNISVDETKDFISQSNNPRKDYSWLSSLFESIALNIITKIFNGISLQLNNINISLLVLTQGDNYNCFLLSIPSLTISNHNNSVLNIKDKILSTLTKSLSKSIDNTTSNSLNYETHVKTNFELTKSITFHSLTVRIFPIQLSDISYDYSLVNSFDHNNVILNPMYINIDISIESISNLFDYIKMVDNKMCMIDIKLSIDNIELTPSMNNLELILESLYSINNDNINIERKIEKTDQSIDQVIDLKELINFSICISRFAFTVYDKSSNDAVSSSTIQPMITVISIVVYGFKCDLIGFPITKFLLIVGMIKVFGLKGIEMVSCGDNADAWIQSEMTDMQPDDGITPAIDITWLQSNKDILLISLSNDDASNNDIDRAAITDADITLKYIDLKISVEVIIVRIDFNTIINLLSAICKLNDQTMFLNSNDNNMDSNDNLRDLSSKPIDTSNSFLNLSKYNHIDFKFAGITVLFNINDDNHSNNNENNDKRINYLVLLVNPIIITSGLKNLNNFEDSSNGLYSDDYTYWYESSSQIRNSINTTVNQKISTIISYTYNTLHVQCTGLDCLFLYLSNDYEVLNELHSYIIVSIKKTQKDDSIYYITYQPCFVNMILTYNIFDPSESNIICRYRFDIFVSDIEIILTSDKILKLINLMHMHSIALSILPNNSNETYVNQTGNALFRDNLKVKYCLISLHCNIDSLSIYLCQEINSTLPITYNKTKYHEVLTQSLSNYSKIISNYGINSLNCKLIRLSVYNQLLRLGFSSERIEMLYEDIQNALKQSNTNNLSNIIDVCIRDLYVYIESNVLLLSYTPIVTLVMSNIQNSYIQLTYDKKISLIIGEFSLFDENYVSLLDISSNKSKINVQWPNSKNVTVTPIINRRRRSSTIGISNNLFNNSNNVSSTNKSNKKKKSKKANIYQKSLITFPWYLQINLENPDLLNDTSSPAITLYYSECDSKWEWGKGGHSHDVKDENHIRNGNLSISLKYIQLYVTLNKIISLASIIIAELNRIKSLWSEISALNKIVIPNRIHRNKATLNKYNTFIQRNNQRRRSSLLDTLNNLKNKNKLIPRNIEIDLCTDMSVHAINCCISNSVENPYLNIFMKKLKLEIDITKNVTANQHNFQYLKFSIYYITVEDLSKLGNVLHHQIIWGKQSDCSSKAKVFTPMISGEFSSDENDQSILQLSIDINGIRICYLNRFLLETIIFVNSNIIEPLNSIIKSLTTTEIKDNLSFVDAISTIDVSVNDEETGESEKSDNDSASSDSDLSSTSSNSKINKIFIKNKTLFNDFPRKPTDMLSSSINSYDMANSHQSEIESNNQKILYWYITIHDVFVITPRNSLTSDLFSLKISSAEVFYINPLSMWSTLSESVVIPDRQTPLFFNVFDNKWHYSLKGERKYESNEFNSNDGSCKTGDDEVNEFYDALEDYDEFVAVLPRKPKRYCTFHKQCIRKDTSTSNHIFRLVISLNNIDAFISRGDLVPTERLFEDPFINLSDIIDNQVVFKCRGNSNTNRYSLQFKQLWKKVTLESFNCLIVLDFSKKLNKILICDTSEYSVLNISLTMAEFYLLLSCVWFDNFFEPIQDTVIAQSNAQSNNNIDSYAEIWPQYGSNEYWIRMRKRLPTFELSVVRAETNFQCYIDYNYFNAEPFCIQFFDEKSKIFKDNDGFERVSLASISVSGFVLHDMIDNETLQLSISAGEVELSDIRNPNKSFINTVLMVPTPTFDSSSDFLKSRVYGNAYFDLGLTANPSGYSNDINIMKDSTKLSPSVRYTFMSAKGSNWGCSNIWIDRPNINIKYLDFILSLSDYFSCYFRFEDYGHPGVAAYKTLNENDIPYGGMDTRLFVNSPHISILEDPLSKSSQFMSLETDKTVYFRYLFDTNGSLKMDLLLYDISIILFKNYITPDKARGLRGSAGSGRGIRTIVEYLCLGFNYHFDKINDKIDIGIKLSHSLTNIDKSNDIYSDSIVPKPTETTTHLNFKTIHNKHRVQANDSNSTNANFVDINKEKIDLSSVLIDVPHAVVTLNTVNIPFTADSVDIVISFEDLSFVIKTCLDFMNFKNTEDLNNNPDHNKNFASTADAPINDDKFINPSTFVLVKFAGVRVILVDNVLGLHLPLFQIYLEDFAASIDSSRISDGISAINNKNRNRVSDVISKTTSYKPNNSITHEFNVFGNSRHFKFNSIYNTNNGELFTLAYSTVTVWADYFNNFKKCWESFLERFECIAMYEKGPTRGLGVTIRSRSAIHLNISSALVRAVGDTINMIKSTTKYLNSDLSIPRNSLNNFDDKPNITRDSTYNWSPHNDGIILNDENFISNNDKPDPFEKIENYKNINRLTVLPKKSRRGSKASFASNINSLLTSNNPQAIIHCESQPLLDYVRVGFSIQNMTGQPVRYLQQWADGKWRVQYINHSERGLLNFIASTTLIRNNQLVEEAFNVQMEYGQDQNRSRNKNRRVGHEVAVQVAGSKWIREVQADVLSVKYHDLYPVIGRINPFKSSTDWKILNALKLMAEVAPHYGGRMLKLTSVFSIKNNTSHVIDLVAIEATANERLSVNNLSTSKLDHDLRTAMHSQIPFKLKVGENFDIPLALLHRSSVASNMKSLGSLYIRPSSIHSAQTELGLRTLENLESIDFSSTPINLMNIVRRTAELVASLNIEPGSSVFGKDLVDNIMIELFCMMSTVIKQRNSQNFNKSYDSNRNILSQSSGKLPPFCYAVEIQRVGTLIEGKKDINRVQRLQARFFQQKEQSERKHDPIHYVIVIHPPIILENLLPMGGIFEIVHASQQKRVLWSSWIDPGKAVPIHTVTLDEPLLLLINIRYARTAEGVIIHEPAKRVGISLVGKIQRTIEGILDEGENDDTTTVVLTDTVGQRLTINIDNVEGQAGQRHIAVYCPYWIVNTSQYTIRIREEGTQSLPAGTVTQQKDGSRQVIILKPLSGNNQQRRKVSTIYPGTKGPFHSSISKEFLFGSDLHDLLINICFDSIVDYAYMFNFGRDDGRFMGKRKVCIQMDEADWSRPFSLDTVGVNQVVSVDNHDFGVFEVGFKIKVAPGRLGKYTKIVRFVPKFVVVNKLNSSIRLLQPVGFTESPKEIEVSGFGCIRPFHLPELFGERKLRLLVDGPWQKTVPFNLDQIGGYTLLVKKKTNLASLHHVNTRGAPEYTVTFPGGLTEIGIWFETDWGEQNTVVKSILDNSYASKQTDIHIGDVLLAIDGEEVRKNFDLNMLRLKSKLKEPGGCEVKFRTVEEKIKKIRDRAIRTKKQISVIDNTITAETKVSDIIPNNSLPSTFINALTSKRPASNSVLSTESNDPIVHISTSANNYSDDIAVRIDIKTCEAFSAIIVSPVNDKSTSEYRVDNMSVSHLIYYKQKGITGNTWSCIAPGYSTSFIWEDPFKPHRLLVLAGRNVLLPESELDIEDLTKISGSDLISNTTMGCISGVAVDLSITEIYFDDIGQTKQLPLPRSDARLLLEVKSQGPAKTLVISPDLNQLKYELKYTTIFVNEQILELNEFASRLRPLLSETKSYGSVENILNSNMKIILQKFRDSQEALFNEYRNYMTRHSTESNKSSFPIYDNHIYKLTSYSPIESVLGLHISKQHQLLIDVLEAKDLMPFVAGKMEDVYCKIYLKFPSSISRDFRQSRYTYVCYQTLDPLWLGQRFIFDIPKIASEEARGFSLRVVIKSKTVIQLNRFLGQTDIHFAGLKNESQVEGWFPLQPEKSSFKASVTTGLITGSVKLKLQWIHSNIGLTKYTLSTIDSRLNELKRYYEIQFNSLQHLRAQRLSATASHRTISHLLPNPLTLTSDSLMLVGNSANALISNVNNIAVSTIKKTTDIVKKSFYSSNNLNSKDFEFDEEQDHSFDNLNNKSILSIEESRDINEKTNEYNHNYREFNVNEDNGINRNIEDDYSDTPLEKSLDQRRQSLRLPNNQNAFDLTPPINTTDFDAIKTPIRPVSVSRQKRHTISGYSNYDNTTPLNLDKTTTTNRLSTSRKSLHFSNIKNWANGLKEFQNKSLLLPTQISEKTKRFKSPTGVTYNNSITSYSHGEPAVYASDLMIRNIEIEKDNIQFHQSCLEECTRSYSHVNLTTGILHITPMHALYIPDYKKSVSVKIGYGETIESTFSIPPAADLTWFQENKSDMYYHETSDGVNKNPTNFTSNNNATFTANNTTNQPNKDFQKTLNDSLIKSFHIDTLNIRGSIRIRVSIDDFPGHKNVAQLDIPVLDLLDCLCLSNSDDDVYDRWFPLLLSSDSLPGEGEMGTINQKLSIFTESSRYDKFGHGRPCIRLKFCWENDPTNSLNSFVTSNDNEKYSKLYTRIQIPSISVSFIDSLRSREISNLTINEINARHIDITKYKADTLINISWIQVDNQLPDATESVIVSPTQVKIHQPVFRLRIRKNNHLSTKTMASFDMIELILQELDLRLDQQLVLSSWDLYQSFLLELRSSKLDEIIYSTISSNNTNSLDLLGFTSTSTSDSATNNKVVNFDIFSNQFQSSNNNTLLNHPLSSSLEGIDITEQTTIYIESLFIGPVKLNVSFITSHDIISFSTSTDTFNQNNNNSLSNELSILTSNNINTSSSDFDIGILSSVFLFVRQVREVVLNLTSSITDAPIFFAGYSVPHLLKTETELTRILLDHYLLSALGQLYKIVGSLDLVGNPVALIQSLGIGVKDFFYEPAHALITSPNDIGKIGRSVVKGTISILSNTTYGILGFGTTITQSMGRNIAKLTMDANYLKSREELARPAQGMSEAFQRPLKDLSCGLSSGVVGLVKVPYNNIRRFGIINGGVTGVAKGVIGLPAKFAVGVLDAVTHTGDAVREVVKVANRQKRKPLHRLRLSNLFGPDGRLLPYNIRNALGTYILNRLIGSINMNLNDDNSNSSNNNNYKKKSRSTVSHHQLRPVNVEENELLSNDNNDIDDIPINIQPNSPSSNLTNLSPNNQTNLSPNNQTAHTKKLNLFNIFNSPNRPSYLNLLSDSVDETIPENITNFLSTNLEFVIYTILIPVSPGHDMVVILTTKRILITMYIRKINGFSIKELWQKKLYQLGTPICEHRGGKITLTVTTSTAYNVQPINDSNSITNILEKRKSLGIGLNSSSNSDKESYVQSSNYTIIADYEYEDMFNVLYNVILTLTNNKNESFRHFNSIQYDDNMQDREVYTFNTITASDFEEDEYGVINIGPWQYTYDDVSIGTINQSNQINNEEIINELEMTKWVITPKHLQDMLDHKNLLLDELAWNIPLWLLDEQILSIKSQNQLKEIKELIDYVIKYGSRIQKDSIKKLKRGLITISEYYEIVNSDVNFENNLIDDDSSIRSNNNKLLSLLNTNYSDDDDSSKLSNDFIDKSNRNNNLNIQTNSINNQIPRNVTLTKKLWPEIKDNDIDISVNQPAINSTVDITDNQVDTTNSPINPISNRSNYIRNFSPFSDYESNSNHSNNIYPNVTPGIGIDITKISHDTVNTKNSNVMSNEIIQSNEFNIES